MTLARPLLENVVRRRVLALPLVRLRTGTRATGLVADGARVTGVTLLDRSGKPSELRADLVVDASGRHSELPEWLAALGVPA